MRVNKFKFFSAITFLCISLSLINVFFITDKKENKSSFIIEYDRTINNQEEGVRLVPKSENTGIEFLPIPNANESITLNAL